MKKIDKTITWTTPSGKVITMTHVIARELIADHTVMADCDDIEIQVNGDTIYGYSGLITHPKHGRVISCHNKMVYVAPDVMDAVIAMDSDRTRRIADKCNIMDAADREYNSHVAKMHNAMTLNGTSL